MGEPGADATDNLTEMQKALLGTQTLEQFLQELATLAARLVTDGVSCGMTMRPTGRPATVACSDPLASEIDEVQYQLDDGPCLHAMRTGDRVSIDDTAGRARWPRFEAAAQARGIRSCLALPLVADGKPVGALNLYARGVAAFGPGQVHRAENLAENASGALSADAAACLVLRAHRAAPLFADLAGGDLPGPRGDHGPGSGAPRPWRSRCCAARPRTATSSSATSPARSSPA